MSVIQRDIAVVLVLGLACFACVGKPSRAEVAATTAAESPATAENPRDSNANYTVSDKVFEAFPKLHDQAAGRTVTRRVVLSHWSNASQLPDDPAKAYVIAGAPPVGLSIEPRTHTLVASGSAEAVDAAVDLFVFFDRGPVHSALFPLHFADPISTANALNVLFSQAFYGHVGKGFGQVLPLPLVSGFLAIPGEKQVLVLCQPLQMQEVDLLLETLDRNPKQIPPADKAIPLGHPSTLGEFTAKLTTDFGVPVCADDQLTGKFSVEGDISMNRGQALEALRTIAFGGGYLVRTASGAGTNGQTMVHIVDFGGYTGRDPQFNTASNPEQTPNNGGALVQTVPLRHTTPAHAANVIRSRVSEYTDIWLAPESNAVVIRGNAGDIHDLMYLIQSLDRDPAGHEAHDGAAGAAE